jgi:predicted RNA-binding Zn-ribbon protein involved in translation (DUF1610 family)
MTPSSIKKAERTYWITVFLVLTVITIPMFFQKPVAQWVCAQLGLFGQRAAWPFVGLPIMALELAALIAAIFVVQRRTLPRCKHCNKTFVPNKIGIVIATKHCPNCGLQVIESAP